MPLQIAQPINRPAVTLCVILAVIMQALDTTIANVALPYMQGSVSASADQINWVLTSYIVAAAIMTPPSGFLANQVRPQARADGGRRRLRVCIRAVRHCAIAGPDRGLPIAARILRRGAGSAWPVRSARHLYGGRTRVCHGPVRRIGDGGAGAGAGDRRLADRPLQLAMGILYQRAVGSARIRRPIVLSEGDQDQRGGEARLARIWQLEHRHCRTCRCFWTGVRNSTGSLPSKS